MVSIASAGRELYAPMKTSPENARSSTSDLWSIYSISVSVGGVCARDQITFSFLNVFELLTLALGHLAHCATPEESAICDGKIYRVGRVHSYCI